MNPRWLMIMTLWSRRPPSARRVKFVFLIVAICLLLVLVEHSIGWPDALRVNRLRP